MPYAADRPPIADIARDLDAVAILECSVRRAGTNIMVTAQLIDARTETQVWSNSYPGDLSDLENIFAMQADIASNIATVLDAELSPAQFIMAKDLTVRMILQ